MRRDEHESSGCNPRTANEVLLASLLASGYLRLLTQQSPGSATTPSGQEPSESSGLARRQEGELGRVRGGTGCLSNPA
jgi:hypothetical protein